MAQGYWWYYTTASTETGDEPEYDRVDVEAAYYRQPQLVSEALKNIAPSDPARADIYFVAAAAFAEQDVFKKEANKARKLFDSRFATKGRSVVMVNHRHTVDHVPLANASNLDAVLSGLAGKMDIENDFLVLFLTSHGSQRRFSVSFDGFSLNDLTPPRLLDILHRSGIKNRVLIISACFSGSFIPELANENTLIMTAAASDRTSFGCSNEREWTYFGDALFNRAFTTTYAFEDAFDMAKGTVGRWEKRDDLTPSEPQISVGSAIKPRLEALAKEFERAAGSPSVEMEGPSDAAAGERADASESP
jgi:Peptidase C13 family